MRLMDDKNSKFVVKDPKLILFVNFDIVEIIIKLDVIFVPISNMFSKESLVQSNFSP